MVVPPTPENLERAAQIIRSGGLVAFPTETVYGLGANALDARAAARIFEAKQRPSFDPLIVHVADRGMLQKVVQEVPALAERLMERFWPGPLTLVLPRSERVPGLVTSGLPTVAVRMPAHPVAQELIRRAGLPLAAPSANPFGYLSPTRAEHVERMLGGRVDLILDGGRTEFGVESTIVLLAEKPTVLRYGAVAVEELERVLGRLELQVGAREKPLVPGQLPQHYAPHTPIRIAPPSEIPLGLRKRVGYLAFQEVPKGFKVVKVLSPTGSLLEAAAHLFEALHQLDRLGLEAIYAEPIPEVGLGRAIMDRLRRASSA
ncbi:L-threonylcarbamoyladenylate synthase [Meiothermus ruber]|jgi:L-threonylcarbamoyladenylate synthase|uniref:Threonylcarbamoyl-AMP synthase n=1 Tax=Meiothermus ruber (strain ATCC 35948 / DSM 1279 / VKM B-1258 / 21) TaxID=504728 RepID=D3PMK5_MEIRD|nr:L-threonylcarbamoyladenylate synthase [Meiothermus ruber]ADD27180.1 Sua5/YciO/YrdC/YwlC family protein [Meiothermus ruber DSM 1279]AGK03632.1 Sua5/YciO/YrdC/YwlC family protein [Meiothermus ruber DSM 1279]MCL6530934.1 threonylcarbamoyl-AMP synthase [Meiothermus ruber]MCX7803415.1 L-threonylcarbamoyladenylate synthase [Meiothermus ruber]GAO74103.1 Sua5/YciO/YrdC/YwlC family protein [Meiothermus ruber H328]